MIFKRFQSIQNCAVDAQEPPRLSPEQMAPPGGGVRPLLGDPTAQPFDPYARSVSQADPYARSVSQAIPK